MFSYLGLAFALVELLVKQLFTMLYCQKYKICTKFSDMW